MLVYDEGSIQIHHDDARSVHLDMPVHAVITDPPYALRRFAGPEPACETCGNCDAMPARYVCTDCLTDDALPRPEFEMLGYVAPNWSEKGTHSRGYHDHDPRAFADLMTEAFRTATETLVPGGHVAAFSGVRTVYQLAAVLDGVGLEVIDQIVWVHERGDYPKAASVLVGDHEPCVLARKPGAKREVRGSNVIRHGKSTEKFGHLTPKPRGLMAELVEMLTEPGETVLDPFMGTGTTLRAAKDRGRRAIGVEIEREWCDVATGRLGQEVLFA